MPTPTSGNQFVCAKDFSFIQSRFCLRNDTKLCKGINQIIEEERKTLKSTLDVDLNLSQHLMSTSQVNISCQHLMSIFQLDFPFLMPSISQYLEFIIYNCYFWVGFPVSAVKYFSKFGILHLRLHFWVGFPISAVKYFSKLKFCIYD